MNTYNAAAVVMHIDEMLSNSEIKALEHKLAQARGVQSAQVSERAQHLLVVKYDPQHASSFNLLNNIKTSGYHAQLIGGI
jgi:cation transport ATPase